MTAGRFTWLIAAGLSAAVLSGCGDGGENTVNNSYQSAAAVGAANNTFTDARDGKVYKTIALAGQTWMAENLNYDAGGNVCFGEGGNVVTEDDSSEYALSSAEVQANCERYGRLYDWETAKRVCPTGHHLPSDDEWNMLVNFVGSWGNAGMKLKSSVGWESYPGFPAGSDRYGFSAMPGGYGYHGRFHTAGYNGYWWSATEDSEVDGLYRLMNYYYEYAKRTAGDKTALFSVRCVAD